MNKHTEEWIDQVLGSTEGMQRAQPSPELLDRIEQTLTDQRAEKISATHWWLAAAAAIILLVINLFATRELLQAEGLQAFEKQAQVGNFQEPLLSDYNFYEL